MLLGDVVELRHGPLVEALARAEPVVRRLAAALPADAEALVVPGNHDHRLLGAWLERRALRTAQPLSAETAIDWRPGEPLAEIAAWLSPARVRAAYPGVWLSEDVYATHGHYSDRHHPVPILERLGAGTMARLGREPATGPGSAEDYEATLAPMYAWIDAVAQAGGLRGGRGGGVQVRAWHALQAPGPGRARRSRIRALSRRVNRAGMAAVFAAGVAGLNAAGLGPLRADLSSDALRRGGLSAFAEVLARLGIEPRHALFGHTHRAGPLPGDDPAEWRAGPTALLNTGSWIHNGSLVQGPAEVSPYRPGFAVSLEDDAPRLVNLLD